MYPQCRHVRPDGEGCHAAALKGSHWCYFHNRLHERYRAQQARHQLHSQRDPSGRFTPALALPLVTRPGQPSRPHPAATDPGVAADPSAQDSSADTSLIPTCDYGTIPVGDNHREQPTRNTHGSASAETASLSLPPVEDSASIQLALIEVLDALAANQIDPKRAGLLLYGLQVASSNAKHVTLYSSSIRSVTYTGDGIPLAPQEYGWDVEDIEAEDEDEDSAD
jgi:hypothetical protein